MLIVSPTLVGKGLSLQNAPSDPQLCWVGHVFFNSEPAAPAKRNQALPPSSVPRSVLYGDTRGEFFLQLSANVRVDDEIHSEGSVS